MKPRDLVISLVLALTLLLSIAGPEASAHALINYTPCTSPQFVRIYYSAGKVCFANDGYIGLGDNGGNLTNVYRLHAGNNNGWIVYYPSRGDHKFYFYAYYEYYFNSVKVTQIFINNQS